MNKNKPVKGFVTSVCKKCGNIARIIPHSVKGKNRHFCMTNEDKEPCRVCGEYKWRRCVLDERIK